MYRNNFWMMHHGSKSPKRTTVWSNRKFLVAGLVHILVITEYVASTCGVLNIKLIQHFVSCLGQGVIDKGHQAEKNKGPNHTFSTKIMIIWIHKNNSTSYRSFSPSSLIPTKASTPRKMAQLAFVVPRTLREPSHSTHLVGKWSGS